VERPLYNVFRVNSSMAFGATIEVLLLSRRRAIPQVPGSYFNSCDASEAESQFPRMSFIGSWPLEPSDPLHRCRANPSRIS